MELNSNLFQQLTRIFPDFDEDTIKRVFASGKQLELKTGEYLFHEGEEEHIMYIVLSGRLRAITENNGAPKVLGDIGAGETVGELAFFTDEPRMASVRAIRNSVVLEFTPEKYLEIAGKNPEFATSFFRLVINRIRRNAFELHKETAPRNVAIIKTHDSIDLSSLKKGVKQYFNDKATPIKSYDAESCDRKDREVLFETLEEHEELNLLFCDDSDMEWTEQCVIYADLIIVAADFVLDHQIKAIEESLDLYNHHILHKKVYLLLIHGEHSNLPMNTSRWLLPRKPDLHIHLRKGHSGDIGRFCRIISNTALGIVLGGGGAKGFAHIGVVRALKEAGIEIDFLGGTSAGALYGIGMAFADFDFDKIHALNEEGIRRKLTSRDMTLPLISLMTGKKFKKYLREMFSTHHLEDIWINTFCISTNLSDSSQYKHRDGLIWKSVLASMAIPGVFPPVIVGNHLHVDGGVMDNLPIEPMYKFPVNTIYAVSLSSLDVKEVTLEEVPTSWSLLRDKFRKKKKFRLPSIGSLITNSVIINSQQKQKETKDKVSHYLELDLKGVKMLDDKIWKEIVDKGYEQMKAYLDK